MKNIPELRFLEFEGEWVQKELKMLADVRDGTHDSPKYQGNGYPLITSKNLCDNGKLDFSNVSLISKDDYDKINKRSNVDYGDILFGMIGTIGNPVIVGENTTFAIKNVALIKNNKNKSTPNYFLYSYLKSRSIIKQFERKKTGNTQKFISLGLIRDLIIKLPNTKEQTKIANFFSLIDQKIEKQKEKVEGLEEWKKGIMQKIFNQDIRFKDDDGKEFPEWEKKKLGDVGQVIMGQSPSSSAYNSIGEGIPLVQGNADLKKGKIFPRVYTREYTKIAKLKDLILTVRAPVGELAITNIESCVGRGACIIRLNNAKYYYYYFLSQRNVWTKYSQGSTFSAISGSDIRSLELDIPSNVEQIIIVNFLSTIDCKINKEKEKLDGLKEMKKGLMQKMFV